MSAKFLVIAGPTGSGKSALALALAARLGGEIVSCDSVQVYRGFEIGAAKPTAAERAAVPHHLLDIVDWHEPYDAARFAEDARGAIAEIERRGRLPIVAGGTGLYLRALVSHEWHEQLPKDLGLRDELQKETTEALYARLETLDAVRADELHPNDRVRIVRALELLLLLGKPLREVPRAAAAPSAAVTVVLDPPRAALHAGIEARSRAMLAAGLLDETRALLARGVDAHAKPMQSIGYKQCVGRLAGEFPEAELLPRICAATRQYAKRQGTWFKKVDAFARLESWDAAALADPLLTALARPVRN